MGGYYRKLFVYIFAALAVALLLVVVNSGALVRSNGQEFDFDRTEPVDTVSQADMEDAETTALVLCDPEDAQSVKYQDNLERVFGWLCIDALFLPADRKDTVSYQDYDLVMVAFSDWEGLIGGDSARLLRYVDGGGHLLLGMMPDEVGGVYQTLSRRMGVTDYGDYLETDGIRFTDELTPRGHEPGLPGGGLRRRCPEPAGGKRLRRLCDCPGGRAGDPPGVAQGGRRGRHSLVQRDRHYR